MLDCEESRACEELVMDNETQLRVKRNCCLFLIQEAYLRIRIDEGLERSRVKDRKHRERSEVIMLPR